MRDAFAASPPQDQTIADAVTAAFPELDPALVRQHTHDVLDIAYTALWSIRSNDPGWRAHRAGLGWIAVSGCDDTPHRPVNVPTAPYPQFDITFSVPQLGTDDPYGAGPQVPVTTRYMIAQAHGWVGPTDQSMTSFVNPDPNLLLVPAGQFSPTPVPRSVPDDTPAISPTSKIIIYVHGGGSRAEEAVGMASYLITEGAAVGEEYTVISFDLPNSAYASPFDVSVIASTQYHPSRLHVLHFEEQFIINFIEALDAQLGNVKSRIVAVMGGSLGGNMSLLLTQHSQETTRQGTMVRRPYLDTMVAWSATATATATYLGLVPQGPVAALAKLRKQVRDTEQFGDHTKESGYLQDMYFNPLVPGVSGITPVVPPQPLMWYRAGQPDSKGNPDWLLCKQAYIAQSRFDRYEIYSVYSRHWAIAIDLEQIWFSFQDAKAPEAIAWPAHSHLMLVAGDWDHYNPNQIFNSTIDVTRMIRRPIGKPPPKGKAEFWADTGHSFHDERPHLFASEIVYFLTHLDAGDSPHGPVITTPQRAQYTETSQ
jgi:pimeloyl-ACP methyl ester carboxylesterase